jgi:hypothetical protein
MESEFKKVRIVQWALLATIPLFAWVAEIGRSSGNSDWTWRYWLAMGLCAWSVSGTFRLRRRMVHRSEEKLKNNATDAKALNSGRLGMSSV